MDPGPHTRLIVLLGDPVHHSFSPRFQNAAIRAAGLDAVYLPLRCAPDQVEGLLNGIARAGGAGNVTIPHKEHAARLVQVPTRAVERTGACNTFWLQDRKIHGDNTDVSGFAAAARTLIGPPAGARVLLLGAGGAARAVVLALIDARADSIHVLNRSVDRARALAQGLDPEGRRVAVAEDPSELRREGFDLVVNATPAGMNPDDAAPLGLHRIARTGAVLDLVCRVGGTTWVREATARGIPAADGFEMLLHQGADAFRRWFEQDPDLDVMRSALR